MPLINGPGLMLIAELDSEVVGVILGTFEGRRGWLHRLAVRPDARRAGTATALVAEIEQRLTRTGASRINLLVMPDNVAGLAFWEHLEYLRAPTSCAPRPWLAEVSLDPLAHSSQDVTRTVVSR